MFAKLFFRSVATLVVVALLATTAQAVDIDYVRVGDPGNAGEQSRLADYGDSTYYGSVSYVYNIGKYEVTNAQYIEFLNAVATVGDPNSLYNTSTVAKVRGTIDRAGSGTAGDPWVYAPKENDANWLNRPVNYVSWYDTLRFCNWLHNGQLADASTTEDGAYDMSLGKSVVRKPGAKVFLPSKDEWYKAAYYKGGEDNAGYWDFPTQSDTAPTAEAPPGADMSNGSANYYDDSFVDPTYYTTSVGAYAAKPSDSPYGTFDQGGNLWEWNETDTVYGDGRSRGMRGGNWGSGSSYHLLASTRSSGNPASEGYGIGFRVASVPEPGSIILLLTGALGFLAFGWRRRRSR